MFEKLKSLHSIPPVPLFKGGDNFKVPLFKGDLGGSPKWQRSHRYFSNIFLGSLGVIYFPAFTHAQVVNDLSLPNPSAVTTTDNSHIISEGTEVERNLFHSFQQFSIPTGQAALFLHNPGIENVVSRVTGSASSSIDGLIGLLSASGGPSTANFFFINPNGIFFGPNAALKVGGSFIASTASSFKFSDGSEFSASNPNPPSLLAVTAPVGLQFGQTPGGIVNQSQVSRSGELIGLSVKPGNTLAFVGGDISLPGGVLFASDGRIELGSVAGFSFVSLTPVTEGFRLGYEGIPAFQDIQISSGFIDVSGDTGGDIAITSRNLSLLDGSVILSAAYENGNNGTIAITTTENLELSGRDTQGFATEITSYLYPKATGTGADITISTSGLVMQDRAIVRSQTVGAGQGGSLTINADSINVQGVEDDSVSQTGFLANTNNSGNAGSIIISAPEIFLTNGAQIRSITSGSGQGGDITVFADFVKVSGTSLSGTFSEDVSSSDSVFPSGLLTQSISNQSASIDTVYGSAGHLKIETGELSVLDGAQIASTTFTNGRAGDIFIQASTVELAGVALTADGQLIITPAVEQPAVSINSGLFAGSDVSSSGQGGNLRLTTQQLIMQDGGLLQTSTLGSGDAGNIDIQATAISLSGSVQDQLYPTSIQALSGGIPGSPFFGFSAATGKGGSINIVTDNLSIQNGAQIAVGSLNPNPDAKGAGSLDIQANQITLANEAKLNAETASGPGGGITLNVNDFLLLRQNSQISATAGIDGQGGDGGNININADFILAVPSENSDITANAFAGRGGNINITAKSVLGITPNAEPSPFTSDITASSQFGIDGTVTLETPDTDPSRGLVKLPAEPIDASRLIAQNCSAVTGTKVSRFTVTGRGGLPPTPTEMVNREPAIEDWGELTSTPSPDRSTRQPVDRTSPAASLSTPSSIVEAQGWRTDANGTVILTAQAPTSTPYPDWQPSLNCPPPEPTQSR